MNAYAEIIGASHEKNKILIESALCKKIEKSNPTPSFARGGTGLANEDSIITDKLICLHTTTVFYYLTVYTMKR